MHINIIIGIYGIYRFRRPKIGEVRVKSRIENGFISPTGVDMWLGYRLSWPPPLEVLSDRNLLPIPIGDALLLFLTTR